MKLKHIFGAMLTTAVLSACNHNNDRPSKEFTETALVTGASNGIGKEIATELYKNGYNLVLAARSTDKLQEVSESLKKIDQRGKIDIISIDLSEDSGAEKLFEITESAQIPISILINNAGVGVYGQVIDYSTDKVQKMLKLNIITPTVLTKLYGERMKERKHGYILNIASIAAYQPVPNLASYASSKSYLLNFSEAAAMELKDYGISVTCFSPGVTDTGFFEAASIPNERIMFNQKIDVKFVAKQAVDAMFKGDLSTIGPWKSAILIFGSRFMPRRVVAEISKNMMQE